MTFGDILHQIIRHSTPIIALYDISHHYVRHLCVFSSNWEKWLSFTVKFNLTGLVVCRHNMPSTIITSKNDVVGYTLCLSLSLTYSQHLLLMNGLVPSQHQAAGHDGCLTSPDNGVVFAKLTTDQEIDFYNAVSHHDELLEASNPDIPSGSLLKDWMPVYMGTLSQGNVNDGNYNLPLVTRTAVHDPIVFPSVKEDQSVINHLTNTNLDQDKKNKSNKDEGKKYIVLQNLYHGYNKPSILDIKLGSKLTDENASPDKVKRLQDVSDSTTSGSLGFRICGMKLYNGQSTELPKNIYSNMNQSIEFEIGIENDQYLKFNKFFGRSLNKDNVKSGISLFFKHGNSTNSKIYGKLIRRFHQRLQLIYNCLCDSEVRIISGSLLFIYENDLAKWSDVLNDDDLYEQKDSLIKPFDDDDDDDDDDEDDGEQSDSTPLSSLHLIDFAHAKYVKGQGCDENILEGIENMINIFEDLIKHD